MKYLFRYWLIVYSSYMSHVVKCIVRAFDLQLDGLLVYLFVYVLTLEALR